MQGIKAKPDGGDSHRREPPSCPGRQYQVRDPHHRSTENCKPGLAKQVDQLLYRGGVEQPANSETANDQADGGEAQAEARVQVGTHIGEGAPSNARLDEHRHDNDASPRAGKNRNVISDETARSDIGSRRGARLRVVQELEKQTRRRDREHSGQHKKHVPPAEKVPQHRRLPDQTAVP